MFGSPSTRDHKPDKIFYQIMKLTIVIPVYIANDLHLDFTRQTLGSIKTKHDHEVLLINNYCAPELIQELSLLASHYPLVTCIQNSNGNILASAWNLGIKLSFASDFCIILNNDILLHPQAIDNLVDFSQGHPEFLLWSGTEWPNQRTLSEATWDNSFSLHPHFSCFMVSPQTIEKIGWFDEHFAMGYFEDNDYHTRLMLAGYQASASTAVKFYHYGSRTINVDDSLKSEAKYHYQKNRAYFKKKWGLDIHGHGYSPPAKILKEIYSHPFNNPKKSLKDW